MSKKKQASGAGRKKEKFKLPKRVKDAILTSYTVGGADVDAWLIIRAYRKKFSNDLWGRWMKEERQFSEIIEYGRQLALAYWMKLGFDHMLEDPKGLKLSKHYSLHMFNRFKWTMREKVETDVVGEITVNFEGGKGKGRDGPSPDS